MQRKCKQCGKIEFLHKTSHIIPNWMYRNLKNDKGQIYLTSSARFERKQTIQSGIYQEYIFCKRCEKIFEHLDTYASLKLGPTLDNHGNNLSILFGRHNSYRTLINCNPEKIKRFFLSVFIRSHFSNHDFFRGFDLGVEVVSEISDLMLGENEDALQNIKMHVSVLQVSRSLNKAGFFFSPKIFFEPKSENRLALLFIGPFLVLASLDTHEEFPFPEISECICNKDINLHYYPKRLAIEIYRRIELEKWLFNAFRNY